MKGLHINFSRNIMEEKGSEEKTKKYKVKKKGKMEKRCEYMLRFSR